MQEDVTIEERMREEEQVKERYDEWGNRWHKLYFGGGFHFKNWLDQCREVYGSDNVEVEEVEASGFRCFECSREKMYRIWARVG
jgi:hypothetical protein